jgi:hypothetical protein
MSLIFTCAELLSSNRESQYFGEVFDFRQKETFSIKGRITGDYSVDDIYSIWSGESGLISYQTGFHNIIVNGINLGTGRLSNINFDKGTDTRDKKYTATIEFYSPSKFSGVATGDYYSGISDFNYYRFINSLGESQSYVSEISGQFSFAKNLTFTLDSSYSGVYPMQPNEFAKLIAASFFENSNTIPLIEAQYPNYINDDSNRFIKETYDDLALKYSFTEKFEYQTGKFYLWNYKNGLNYSQDGTISVTEDGNIRPSKRSGNKIEYSESGWSEIQTGIYSRVSNIYNYYSGDFGSGAMGLNSSLCELKNTPVSKSVSRDKCNGFIDYNYTYSNDPAFNSGYSYEYSDSISYNLGGYSEVTQNGTIISNNPNRGSGFSEIETIFDTVIKPGLPAKRSSIYSRYLDMTNSGCFPSGTLNQVASQETFEEWNEKIDYNYSFSDDPAIINSGNIFSIKKQIRDQKPVHIVGYFSIVNSKVLATKSNQSTVGVYSNTFDVVGKSGASLTSLLSACYSRVSKPAGECWINDFNYSYSPFDNSLNMDLTYSYSVYRPFESIVV